MIAIDKDTAAGNEERRNARLVIFTRFPQAGQTKTRLIPMLGAEGAADLHRRMAEHAVMQARKLADARPLSIEIYFEGASERAMRRWLGPQFSYHTQGAGDIGERMERAFRRAFQDGARRVALIGSDCPARNAAYLAAAFDALERVDLALGPAHDGGYHLIGLRRHTPQLFSRIDWGTERVLSQTLAVADKLSLSHELLDALPDIDRPEDLTTAGEETNRLLQPPTISVIVPAFNEAENIAAAIRSAAGGPAEEVIVVDGGSCDGTPEIAREQGARVIASARGRAAQMNAGADAATGEILLFLHADTRLPEDWASHARRALAAPAVVGGAFSLRIDSTLRSLRLIELGVAWRSRFRKMPYGDQALFVKAMVFRELDGFPLIPIMEDFKFMRRLRRRGEVVILPLAATTSARRWRRLGPWKTTLINQLVIAGYHMGAPLPTLAKWYDRRKAGRPS
jgi:hypothetical protein